MEWNGMGMGMGREDINMACVVYDGGELINKSIEPRY